MSKNRIQYTDDFVLKNEKVGINTSDPQETLHVDGNIRTEDAISTHDTTLNEFSGFNQETLQLTEHSTVDDSTRGSYNALSSEVKISSELTVTEGNEVSLGRTETLTVTNRLKVPSSGSEDREDTPEKGSTRFNEDLGQLEFYTGLEWRTVGSYDGSGRGRGVFGGGSPVTANMQYINIQSTGNSENFGNLTAVRASSAGCSSSTRGLVGGSDYLGNYNTIDYITIASQGNGNDFGDLTYKRSDHSSCSSSTRGVWAGGYDPVAPKQSVNVIDYVEISTLGDALDFGDLSDKVYSLSGCSSSTRGIFAGGGIYLAPAPGTPTSSIRSITISSKGDSTKFGDLTSVRTAIASCSNAVRGLFAAGSSAPNINLNTISYVTISSYGNAIDFGNLAQGKSGVPSGVSNSTRGVFAGGVFLYPTRINTIEYISINSGGNAIDFGDLANPRSYAASMSDSHGGLGGF